MNDVSFKDYIDQRFHDQEKAVQAALAAAEKAVDKAEANAERWRNNANEWRGAMTDRERDFLSRKEFYSIIATAVGILTLLLAIAAFVLR